MENQVGSRDNPLWTRESRGGNEELAAALDVASRVILFAYMALAAWQMLTILNPPLKVKQDLFVARVKQRFARPADVLPELTNADRAAIYDATR